MQTKSVVVPFFILVIVLASGMCTEQEKNLTAIKLGDQVYEFSTNLYDSVKVKTNDEDGIKELFDNSENVCIKFDNSSSTDNAYFAVVGYNIVFKLTRYYSKQGKTMKFSVCQTNETTIWLKGPETGAQENSVTLIDNTVVVQGTDFHELELAGDKLVLTVFGINSLK